MSIFDEPVDELPDVPDELLEDEDRDGDEYGEADVDASFDETAEPDFDDERAAQAGGAIGGSFTGSGEPDGDEQRGRPMFDRLDDWVSNWLIPVYVRSLEGAEVTWCAKWWLHPEAYVRLDSLWRAWEYHRLQPGTGMAVFMRDYLDHHMVVLISQSGPFTGCKPSGHGEHLPPAFPTELMPTDAELEAAYRDALRALGVDELKGRHGEIAA
jgi:hypothetical protein